MIRRYYSSRKSPGQLTLTDLYWKLQNLYVLFRDGDYFKGKAGITQTSLPDSVKRKAAVDLDFRLFPITEWPEHDITEDHVFDALEFLYAYVSLPCDYGQQTTDTGYNYYDYDHYDEEGGRAEFKDRANAFLADYKLGYELTEDGTILALGTGGLQYILDAEIIPYDENNVDRKVRSAITKWRNRHLALADRREAIRELADVFEWLKKTNKLAAVLDRNDESAIFELANNFAIRHHNPNQKTSYDQSIWYPWMFHFYLATYHAAIRLVIKDEKRQKP